MTVNARPNESQVDYHRRRLEELKTVRHPWESVWRALAEFIEPTRLRLNGLDEGALSRSKIIDSSATFSHRTLASGMHSGLTSPARPWFKLTTTDPDLKDFAPVKEYLALVERTMREAYQGSNVYNTFHMGYGDLGQFGQSAAMLVEDEQSKLRMISLLHGQFWIARDENGRATTLYRVFRWSVQRIVSRFGYRNCSHTIQQQFDQANYDKLFDICHAVEPRLSRDPSSTDRRNKPFLSNYWESDRTDRDAKLLEESGFDSNPIIAPGWEIAGEDNYALSPGQIALADIKMLQKEQTRKLEAIDKMVRPPMQGPTSMKNNPASLLPGSLTYVDDPTGKGYRPVMEVNLRLSDLQQDIGATSDRINTAFYADLFMMLSNMEGVQPRNVMELAERKEEKLLMLGPVLENIYNGQLEPTIDRTFEILERRDELPPPPVELQGQDLKIEYISMLAQAQKAVATGSIERVASFIGNLAAVKPDILDKFDADEAVDQYADMVGAPPSIIVPDDEVAKMREQRAQQQQAAQNAEMAASMAPAAKAGAEAARLMSDADMGPSGSGLLQQIGMI